MRYLFFGIMLFFSSFLMAQEEEGPPYHIFSIYFGGGSYYIDSQQEQAFYEWIDGIPGIDNHEISVHSHTDDIGGKEYNAWLSRMRSESGLRLLMNKHIDREQISIEDFGELNPIYDNSTWEGRLKNRRVDIIIKPLVM